MSRAEEVLELTRDKLRYARRFFGEGDMGKPSTISWSSSRTINIVKDLKNSTPVHEHTTKLGLFQLYCGLGILRRDYSPSFDRLMKLRIRADFGPYRWTPRIPERGVVEDYLREGEEIFAEAERHVPGSRRKK